VPGMGFTNRGNLFKRFFTKNISVSTGIKVKKIIDNGLLCEKAGMEFTVCADTVVSSIGMQPRSEIKQQLAGRTCEFLQVGNCNRIGNMLKAFHGGYETADSI
ncbi:MAG: hypothetical protein FWG35_02250, partial [Spirochaetaceae bacterium]|nr:hypothetical protein [Spirochaetaceae bacterium]